MKERGDELFSSSPPKTERASPGEPLASRMRPRTLDEFIGQDHIVGPGRLLRRAIQKDQLSSLILSGPPGTGKTTLARVIAGTTQARFVSINAVLAGVQAIRDAVEGARKDFELYDRRTILFVDEVHRWNKAQQDALLPWVEQGTIMLIGATTENPYFEVNKALVSRSRVFQLEPLSEGELLKAARAALRDRERGYGAWEVAFEPGALEHLVRTASGDARNLLNALELAVETSVEPWPPAAGSRIVVGKEAAEESIQRRAVLYDKDGDYHYDAISAFIKSLRGSDPDAALYWLARMVYAGEDPRFLWRRMLISAAEDVGLADPRAVSIVESCAAAFDRIGLQEGQFHLAEAALYLATAPKSNSALAYFDALKTVEDEQAEVPDPLKDANRDAEGLGHGKGYLYPHAFKTHWVAQQYLPDSLKGRVFYQPGQEGYEAGIRDGVLRRRDAQLAAAIAEDMPGGERAFRQRAESGRAGALLELRDELWKRADPKGHENVLILSADDGLLLREAVRVCPRGSVSAWARTKEGAERLAYFAGTLPELERPFVSAAADWETALAEILGEGNHASPGRFDLVMGFDALSAPGARHGMLRSIVPLVSDGGALLFCERAKPTGVLSGILAAESAPPSTEPGQASKADLANRFSAFEASFYARIAEAGTGPGMDGKGVLEAFSEAGLAVPDLCEYPFIEKRTLDETELESWFSAEKAYGSALGASFPPEERAELRSRLVAIASKGPLEWPFTRIIVAGRR